VYLRTPSRFGLRGVGLGDALVSSLASAITNVEDYNPNFAGNNNPGNLIYIGPNQNGQSGVTRGAVYATLDRLEDKGLLASWLSEPSKERGGRARRYYRLEKSGEQALRESAEAAKRLYETLARSWKGLAWKTQR